MKKKAKSDDEERRPSRSALKRQSTALQKLGEDLAGLDPAARATLDLPQELSEALALHDRIHDREGAGRQRQFIGRLMRNLDSEAIARALASRQNVHAAHVAEFHRAERLRDRLLNCPEQEIDNTLAEIVPCDKQEKLRELLLRARGDGNSAGTRARRELFRELMRILS